MKKIDRYLPVLKKDRKGKLRASVHKDPYGKYILFEEHVKRICRIKSEVISQETLRDRIRKLEEENEMLRCRISAYDF